MLNHPFSLRPYYIVRDLSEILYYSISTWLPALATFWKCEQNPIYSKNASPQICVPKLAIYFIDIFYKPLFNTF